MSAVKMVTRRMTTVTRLVSEPRSDINRSRKVRSRRLISPCKLSSIGNHQSRQFSQYIRALPNITRRFRARYSETTLTHIAIDWGLQDYAIDEGAVFEISR